MHGSKTIGLGILMGVQAFCAVFFLNDVLGDLRRDGFALALVLEVVANLTLMGAVVIEGWLMRQMIRAQARSEHALSVARGALADVVDERLRHWGLTPAEAEVALFTLKGYSIAEVAGLRGSSEGTVKSHLNAVYRKAGVSGRAQLVALFVEDLFAGPIAAPEAMAREHAA